DRNFWGHSSDPSEQSLSPSQRHIAGTHIELLHWKERELQVGLGQDASSEPSEQSLSLSQTNIKKPQESQVGQLITSITTIISFITNPPAGDAPPISALKLIGVAYVGCICERQKSQLEFSVT
uniref:Uncharacterized protein n=1 Tax=Astatotilapia calliptera TaxID=8154 RepID=A0A3P8P3L6_ASTCA